jgi:hypothetical protein
MENLYQPSQLLTKNDFDLISKALDAAWAADTTYPDLIDDFTDSNKALGHCATTSVIINDLFGGRMIYDKANFHVWNELPDGTEQDFTRSQFKDDRIFTIYKYQTRQEVLQSDVGKRTNIIPRYEVLKKRFLKNYSVLIGKF